MFGLDSKIHPYMAPNFRTEMHNLTKQFNLSDKAKEIVLNTTKNSIENLRKESAKWTDYNIPYLYSGLLAGVGAASWYYGMPYLSFIIGTIDVLGSSAYACIKVKLKSHVEKKLYKEGVEACFQATGKRLLPIDQVSFVNKQKTIQMGIYAVNQRIKNSFKFVKKSVPAQNKDEKPRETYVSSYESDYAFFSEFTKSDVTATQRKRNKPQRPIQESKSFKTIKPEDDLRKSKDRIIKAPERFDGQIFEGNNGSLMALLPPTAKSKITREDVKEMMGAREEDHSFAKKRGQSGPKLSTNGMFSVKNKFTKERFEMEEQENITVEVDGKPQNIPVYNPCVDTLKEVRM